MKADHNDLFRFISVRGAEPVYTTDPTKDIPDLEVIESLSGIDVDTRSPNPKIPTLLARIPVANSTHLNGSNLASWRNDLDATEVATVNSLIALTLRNAGGRAEPVGAIAESEVFHDEYRKLANSWLKLILTRADDPAIPEHADLLRVAHLIHLAGEHSTLLSEGGAIRRVRHSRLVPPSNWLPAGRLNQRVLRHHQSALGGLDASIGQSSRGKAIAAAKAKHRELVARRETMERIFEKSQIAYVAWKREQGSAGELASAQARGASSRFSRLRWAAGIRRMAAPVRPLNADFFSKLQKLLDPQERALYKALWQGQPAPDTVAGHDAGMAPDRWTPEANQLCHQIHLWEDADQAELPGAPPKTPTTEHPLVRSIGWGDLVVARESLIGYEAREIAHIENVMPGESRLREHERQRSVEQVVERETLEETESQRDLETTDRFELQAECQTTVQEDYSIETGLNTSGKYGLTRVETSLQAGMTQSKSEARSSSQTLAREVVSKAVERTFERVREMRRQTITEKVRELNRHGLKNRNTNGSGASPSDISGIYLWAEKLVQVELRHFGTRMLVEFYIPEPAISLLERKRGLETSQRRPAPFTLSPSDILPENYLCLTGLYGAQDVDPPPAQYILIGYSWASTPNEESDSTGQGARADTIAVPRGYRPSSMTALVSAHPGKTGTVTDVFMAIGGHIVVVMHDSNYGESGQAPDAAPNPDGPIEIDFEPSLSWPAGVPVVVRATGAFDDTLVAEATLKCIRTAEALDNWRLRTWEQLRAAHEVLLQAYRSEVERQTLEVFASTNADRPESENRRVEAEELRKWAIKAMRLQSFNFNAIVGEQDGAQEIDPLAGDLMATVARFFEEAFEWSQESYFLYPYYWGRREAWNMRLGLNVADARHGAFLRAGAARLIVPVTPGYEERVVRYLESDGNELERLGPTPSNYSPEDPGLEDLWLELLLDRRPELALGSGSLNVQRAGTSVAINTDSNWDPTDQDVGRELYIDGDVYTVKAIPPAQPGNPKQITLDEPFRGQSNPTASYATGSVPYGPPWVERVPTSLVILEGNRPRLGALRI